VVYLNLPNRKGGFAMDYDRIILELLNRISILEEKVKVLENSNIPKGEINEQSEQLFSPSLKAEIPKQPKQYNIPTNNGRDNTKYMLDGVRYGKNRLVLAIVKKYVVSYPDITAEELMLTFDKSLQGSFGVVRTVQDVVHSYADSKRRFFLRPNEVIDTSTEQCAVCTQWGSFNIKNIITRAKELGMTITEI